jgi:hypothetical protein
MSTTKSILSLTILALLGLSVVSEADAGTSRFRHITDAKFRCVLPKSVGAIWSGFESPLLQKTFSLLWPCICAKLAHIQGQDCV